MVKTAYEAIKEILVGTKLVIVSSRELPLVNRMFLYVFILVGYVVGILSLAFCVVALWLLITVILDGSLFDNPPAEDWDIR